LALSFDFLLFLAFLGNSSPDSSSADTHHHALLRGHYKRHTLTKQPFNTLSPCPWGIGPIRALPAPSFLFRFEHFALNAFAQDFS
jgi:hypothetical protein